jgi:N-acetylmuramoyl-L-alanine amidase
MFKKFKSFLLITFMGALLVFGGVAVSAANTKIPVQIGSTSLDGVLIEEKTYVSLVDFGQAVDPSSRLISTAGGIHKISARGITVSAQLWNSYIEANGRYLYTPIAIFIYEDSLYLPIRLLSKAFDATVGWNGETYSVSITRGSGAILSGDRFYASDEVYWLSRIISAGSAGQPLKGKIAVGNVVLNRVAHRSYPNTIYGVIFDRKYGTQFEPVLNGTIYRTPNAESVIAAKICLEGYTISDEILFFYNPRIAESNWIARNREFFAVIGDHWFYY